MKNLKEGSRKELVFRLDEAIVFLGNLIVHEIDHDPGLVKEGMEHLKSLLLVHSTLTLEE